MKISAGGGREFNVGASTFTIINNNETDLWDQLRIAGKTILED